MTKDFCDLCEKELLPVEKSYYINIEPRATYMGYNLCKEVCEECMEKIRNMLIKKEV